MFRGLRNCLLVAGLLASGGALAAPCAGFTDVDDTSPFCPNVEWMKNRAITLGCAPTLYCPVDQVTRLQIAAFMNRLGTAMTPVYLYQGQGIGAVATFTVPLNICATSALPAAPYPRQVHHTVTLSVQTLGGLVYTVTPVFSTDGGTTWQLPANAGIAQRGGSYAPWWASATAVVPYDLAPNQSYVFGLRTQAVTGDGWLDSRCQVAALVTNRNGTSSPLDEAP
jgi:hypothetical protein